MATRSLWVRGVGDDGLAVVALDDRPVDVCIDGRRVWTFWSRRDTEPVVAPLGRRGSPWRRVPWPRPLQRHLTGRGRISLRDPATGAVFFDREMSLGEGEGPLLVQNRSGVDLGIDKSGRLVPTFAGRSAGDIAALLDAVERAIDALRGAGIEPFLAYGTLLGAVREGTVLGHDSDADLGYVSHHTTPVDVARESFEVQRRLVDQGWRITRYSGAAFKIYVEEGEVTRGLDVFGGFLDAGRLYLMGEVGTEFESDWVFPLGTTELEGRPMPAPARPEKLLEAMYGPGWRVPDPAFKFSTPARTVRALDDWFRGLQPGIRTWDRRASQPVRKPLRRGPSGLARQARKVAQRLGAEVLDVGAGDGADSLWLARRGLAVRAYDYVPRALETAGAIADQESLDFEVRRLNLTEWRSVYAEGARLAHRPRPRVVLARHVVDATSGAGREALARLCSMALREGGQLLAEFYLPGDRSDDDPEGAGWPEWIVGRPDVEEFATLLRRAGAAEVEVTMRERDGRPTVKLVGVW